MPIQAETLLKLQDLDTEIARRTRERHALDDGSALQAKAEAIARTLAEAEGKLHHLQAEQQAAELQLQSVEAKKAHEEKRLYSGKVTVPRELQAIEQEIEMLGRQRSRLDEQILLLMEEVEATSAAIARLQEQVRIARARWEKHHRDYVAEARRLDGELARLTRERAEVAAQLEPAVLRQYEEIRARSANLAAVRLEGNLCGGCRTNVSIVLARAVAEGERYVRCESCNRFLLPAPE